MSYKITLLIFWILWCFFHSFLISQKMNKLIERSPKLKRWHRLFYNIFSLGTFIPLFYVSIKFDHQPLTVGPVIYALSLPLFLASFFFFYVGSKRYDLLKFLGIKPEKDRIVLDESLVQHPWYTGTFLLIWAIPSYSKFTIAIRIILSLYLYVGTLLEERKLQIELGESYQNYRKNTPRYIPRFRKR